MSSSLYGDFMGMNVSEALARHIRTLNLSPLDRAMHDTDCFVIDHRNWIVQGPYPEDMAKEYAMIFNEMAKRESGLLDQTFYAHRKNGDRVTK